MMVQFVLHKNVLKKRQLIKTTWPAPLYKQCYWVLKSHNFLQVGPWEQSCIKSTLLPPNLRLFFLRSFHPGSNFHSSFLDSPKGKPFKYQELSSWEAWFLHNYTFLPGNRESLLLRVLSSIRKLSHSDLSSVSSCSIFSKTMCWESPSKCSMSPSEVFFWGMILPPHLPLHHLDSLPSLPNFPLWLSLMQPRLQFWKRTRQNSLVCEALQAYCLHCVLRQQHWGGGRT